MSRLAEIAIRVEAPRSGGLGGGVAAVLTELVCILERVSLGGEAATVDLRSLPMSPEDRAELQGILGQGEVRASLSAEGISTFQETGVSGIWWVEHRNRQDDVVAELIEVSVMPKLLEASMGEMAASALELRSRLSKDHAHKARMDDVLPRG